MLFLFEEVLIFMIAYYVLTALSYLFAPRIISNAKDKVKDTHLYYSYFPAAVHAIVSTILVFIKLYYEGLNDGNLPSVFSKIIVAQSLGYFIHDTVKSEIFSLNELPMRIHHLSCLVGFSNGLTRIYGPSELCNGLLIAEFSNLFLTNRSFMKYLNLKSNVLYLINEALFAFAFIIMRIFIGPIYTTNLFYYANTPFITKLFGFMLNFISIIWVAEILSTIGMKFTMNAKSKLGIIYRKFAIGVKKSPLIFACFFGVIAIPQIAMAIHNHLNSN